MRPVVALIILLYAAAVRSEQSIEFIPEQDSVEIKAVAIGSHDTLKLVCKGYGHELEWRYKGQDLPKHLRQSFDDKERTLLIPNFSEKNDGVYECKKAGTGAQMRKRMELYYWNDADIQEGMKPCPPEKESTCTNAKRCLVHGPNEDVTCVCRSGFGGSQCNESLNVAAVSDSEPEWWVKALVAFLLIAFVVAVLVFFHRSHVGTAKRDPRHEALLPIAIQRPLTARPLDQLPTAPLSFHPAPSL